MKNKPTLSILLIIVSASLLLTGLEIGHRQLFEISPLGRVWEEFLYILVFLCLFVFSKLRTIKILTGAFLFLSFVVNSVHYEIYQSWVNGVNYYLSLVEWSEVLHTGVSMIPKLIPSFLWGLMEFSIVMAVWYLSYRLSPDQRFLLADILFIVLMGIICTRSFSTNQEHGISPKVSYGNIKSNYFSLGYFLGRILPYKVLNLNSIQDYTAEPPTRIQNPIVDHIIIVMGESETATHAGALGYHRNTTPFFSRMKGQKNVILRDIHSAGFMTRVALPSLFNAIPQPNGLNQIMKGHTNLFRLAKDQKIETFWYCAQAKNEMNILNLIGQKWIDHTLFPSDMGYSDKSNMPDFNLIEPFEAIDFSLGRQFVVLHQRGSHTPYGINLPEEVARHFGDTALDRYDATILNTDKLIERVHQIIRDKKLTNWLLIYTSDHGAYVTDRVYNQGTRKVDSYTVPLFITGDNHQALAMLERIFVKESPVFHQQLSTALINLFGYEKAIPDGSFGTVTGNLLNGNAGYLKYENGQYTYVNP